MAAVSAMEHTGIPIDVEALRCLRSGWEGIQDQLIANIDRDYGVYEGRTFKRDKFETFLQRAKIPWPRLESGVIDLDRETFKQASKVYPIIAPLRELRHSLSDMRLSDIAVGSDGRNRCLLSPFKSETSRNQPSPTHYICGPSVWLRGLIKPPPGYGVALLDWAQQEFGIAAAISKIKR